ncbi:hypothetical protein PINS_up011033 [Pythium insidiosum]|nr:hypothetical protein PINS_up011033 [Pythium insidiosum]
MCPVFPFPSRERLSELLLDQLFNIERSNVIEQLRSAKLVTVFTDESSTASYESVINFPVSVPERRPVFWTIVRSSARHTPESMFMVIEEVIKDIEREIGSGKVMGVEQVLTSRSQAEEEHIPTHATELAAATSDRAWSAFNYLHSQARDEPCSPETVDKVVFIYANDACESDRGPGDMFRFLDRGANDRATNDGEGYESATDGEPVDGFHWLHAPSIHQQEDPSDRMKQLIDTDMTFSMVLDHP